jgi:hypothetical protein
MTAAGLPPLRPWSPRPGAPEDLAGRRFGDWEVVGFLGTFARGRAGAGARWAVRCAKCGLTRPLSDNRLVVEARRPHACHAPTGVAAWDPADAEDRKAARARRRALARYLAWAKAEFGVAPAWDGARLFRAAWDARPPGTAAPLPADPDVPLGPGNVVWVDSEHLLVEPDETQAAIALLASRLGIPRRAIRNWAAWYGSVDRRLATVAARAGCAPHELDATAYVAGSASDAARRLRTNCRGVAAAFGCGRQTVLHWVNRFGTLRRAFETVAAQNGTTYEALADPAVRAAVLENRRGYRWTYDPVPIPAPREEYLCPTAADRTEKPSGSSPPTGG